MVEAQQSFRGSRMYHEDGANSLRPRYGSIVDDERLSAEEMDERRRQNIAYEYLCHLEEAKQWIEACVGEQLPPTTELENGLRNGVYLGKLARFFAPQLVSEKKIYDRDQSRYKTSTHPESVIAVEGEIVEQH